MGAIFYAVKFVSYFMRYVLPGYWVDGHNLTSYSEEKNEELDTELKI